MIVRFLLGALLLGVLVGYVRRTWFSENKFDTKAIENLNAGIASVVENREQTEVTPVTGPINLNTATKTELMTLPGIGPKMAERIILYRQDQGDFLSVEDLKKVKGIGNKLLARLQDKVTI
ncbi:MAG: ComEA family DNA-binding protein [Fidelibacterota bacterium]